MLTHKTIFFAILHACPPRQGGVARGLEPPRAAGGIGGRSLPAAPSDSCRTACRPRPVFRQVRLALLLAILAPIPVAAGASAATLDLRSPRPWTAPGANPCDGACDARWALERMRVVMPPEVHAELARRVDAGHGLAPFRVATGDRIRAMSYARDGVPFVEFARRVAQFPEGTTYAARGFVVLDDGVLYRFVQVAACGNWALIVERPVAGFGGGFWSGAGRYFASGGAFGGGGISGGGGTLPGENRELPGQPPLPAREVETPPAPIPAPATLALFAGCLAALAGLRRRGRQTSAPARRDGRSARGAR